MQAGTLTFLRTKTLAMHKLMRNANTRKEAQDVSSLRVYVATKKRVYLYINRSSLKGLANVSVESLLAACGLSKIWVPLQS